jgi:hypothetical protein
MANLTLLLSAPSRIPLSGRAHPPQADLSLFISSLSRLVLGLGTHPCVLRIWRGLMKR